MRPLLLTLSAILLLTIGRLGTHSRRGNRRMPAWPLTGAKPRSTPHAIVNTINGNTTITAVMARRSRSGPHLTAVSSWPPL